MRHSALLPLALLLAFAGAAEAGKKKKDEGPAPLPDNPAGARKGDMVPLMVVCATPGANIFVDGDMVGMTPLDLAVPVSPGDHSLKVTRLGFAPYIDVFSTRGKREVKVEIELIPVSGVVHVTSTAAGSRVLIDGKYVGDAPVDVEADIGPRAVQVSKPGYRDYFQNIVAVAGQDVNVDVKLEELPDDENPYKQKPPPPPKWYQKGWVWGVVAVAAVVVAGGAVGAVLLTRDYPLCDKADISCGVAMPLPSR